MPKPKDHIRESEGRASVIFCGGTRSANPSELSSISKRAAKARKDFAGCCQLCVRGMKAEEATR